MNPGFWIETIWNHLFILFLNISLESETVIMDVHGMANTVAPDGFPGELLIPARGGRITLKIQVFSTGESPG